MHHRKLYYFTIIIGLIGLLLFSAWVEAQSEPVTPIASLKEADPIIFRLSWQPPNASLLAVAIGHEIRLYLPKLELVEMLQGHNDDVFDLDWRYDGAFLVSASADSTVKIWDVNTGQSIATLPMVVGPVFRVRWSPDGEKLAIATVDISQPIYRTVGQVSVSIWDVSNPFAPKLEHTLPLITGVSSIGWTIDSNTLITTNNVPAIETVIRSWNANTGLLAQEYIHDQGISIREINDFARRPTSNVIAIARQWTSFVTTFNVHDNHSLLLLRGHLWETILNVDWNPDGQFLTSGDIGGEIKVWDFATAEAIASFSDPLYIGEGIEDLDWSPDGRFIASIHANQVVHIWDVSTLTALTAMPTATYFPYYYDDNGTPIPPAAPSVTIELLEEVINSNPITLTVRFSEPVIGFEASDINLSASTVSGRLTASVTGSDDIYRVSIQGMTGSGVITATIPADSVQDWEGTGNLISNSIDVVFNILNH